MRYSLVKKTQIKAGLEFAKRETPWSGGTKLFGLMRPTLSLLAIRQDAIIGEHQTHHPHCEARWWQPHTLGVLSAEGPERFVKVN